MAHHFLDLPDELMVHCLSFLDISSMKSVAMVSKRFNRLSKDENVWKGVYFHMWPCSGDLASHPIVQEVLHCNSWRESALYRKRLYERFDTMISYPRFRQKLEQGKYCKFARWINVEALMAQILCIGVFGVPGVGEGYTWVEHQRLALRNFLQMPRTVNHVLREMFVNTSAFDDDGGPGVRNFMQYTDWAKDFHSTDIFGILWNVGLIRIAEDPYHGGVSDQYTTKGMDRRTQHGLYVLIHCTTKRPAAFVYGGLPYVFSNHPIACDGPFIIDPRNPQSSKEFEADTYQYSTKQPWFIAYLDDPAHYNYEDDWT